MTALDALTVAAGTTVALDTIGGAGAGVTGTTGITATTGITFVGIIFRTNQATYDAGGPLVDRISLPLGADDQIGDYWMSLAVFKLSAEGEALRLPVTLPDGSVDNQVGLGPLRVEDSGAVRTPAAAKEG